MDEMVITVKREAAEFPAEVKIEINGFSHMELIGMIASLLVRHINETAVDDITGGN